MPFNIIVFGSIFLLVTVVVGVIAWFMIPAKKPLQQAAQQMVPMVQPQPTQPIVRYEGPRMDSELDRKLLRVQRVLQQKYEAKADAAAIAEAYELLGEES